MKISRLKPLTGSAVLVALLVACGPRADDQQVALRIQALLDAGGGQRGDLVRNFYRERSYEPAWSARGRMRNVATELVTSLGEAASHGLAPEEYGPPSLDLARSDAAAREAQLAELDVALTGAFLLYAQHLSHGRLDPRSHGMGWHASDEKADVVAALTSALGSGSVRATLEGLAPTHQDYRRLREALLAYRETPDAAPDGEQSRILELNLERWRWLPPKLESRYLVVNIPDFSLRVIEEDREVLSMRVVVGKVGTSTPVLSDTMTTLVLNPYWNVPESIASGEILPALREDPSYLERHGMELVSLEGEPAVLGAHHADWNNVSLDGVRIRQRPGAGNALGDYKFVFPNHLNIYLHDTPADHLFERAERGFSHGCVRIERPEELAAYVLRGEGDWPASRVAELLAAGREVHIPLTRPLPVHIVYFTAWADEGGRVQFREDVYGRDTKLASLLSRRGAALAKAVSQPAGKGNSATKAEAPSQAGSG